MTILTPSEAANWIRSTETDQIMLMLMPQVDAYLERATGRDWSADTIIHPLAKTAAGVLLVNWYDNPAMTGSGFSGFSDVLTQLEVEALKYRKYEIEGLKGAGAIYLPGAREGDTIIKLVGVYGLSGDQTAKFESAISEENRLVQTYSGDLSEVQFVLILKSPAEDITA
jgi:hypothetical protein